MSKPYLEPSEWYASLPTVYVSAIVLLTNTADQVLLVKPNYRPYWALPGGIIDEGEAPHQCAVREVAEELGLTITLNDLLVIDWAPPQGDRPRPMTNYLFDAGTLHDPTQIVLQSEELDDAQFFSWDDAAAKLPANTRSRIPAARTARKDGRTIYLPVSQTST